MNGRKFASVTFIDIFCCRLIPGILHIQSDIYLIFHPVTLHFQLHTTGLRSETDENDLSLIEYRFDVLVIESIFATVANLDKIRYYSHLRCESNFYVHRLSQTI